MNTSKRHPKLEQQYSAFLPSGDIQRFTSIGLHEIRSLVRRRDALTLYSILYWCVILGQLWVLVYEPCCPTHNVPIALFCFFSERIK